MEWKPIETAPKDGTEILGYREDSGILLIRWTFPASIMTEQELDSSDLTSDQMLEYAWFFSDFIQGGMLQYDEVPTHWMPLPEPPK